MPDLPGRWRGAVRKGGDRDTSNGENDFEIGELIPMFLFHLAHTLQNTLQNTMFHFLGEVEIFLFVLPIEWCGHKAFPQQKLFQSSIYLQR